MINMSLLTADMVGGDTTAFFWRIPLPGLSLVEILLEGFSKGNHLVKPIQFLEGN